MIVYAESVIARSAATRQSRAPLDCFAPLAMTTEAAE